jgi:hypothetical protein
MVGGAGVPAVALVSKKKLQCELMEATLQIDDVMVRLRNLISQHQ